MKGDDNQQSSVSGRVSGDAGSGSSDAGEGAVGSSPCERPCTSQPCPTSAGGESHQDSEGLATHRALSAFRQRRTSREVLLRSRRFRTTTTTTRSVDCSSDSESVNGGGGGGGIVGSSDPNSGLCNPITPRSPLTPPRGGYYGSSTDQDDDDDDVEGRDGPHQQMPRRHLHQLNKKKDPDGSLARRIDMPERMLPVSPSTAAGSRSVSTGRLNGRLIRSPRRYRHYQQDPALSVSGGSGDPSSGRGTAAGVSPLAGGGVMAGRSKSLGRASFTPPLPQSPRPRRPGEEAKEDSILEKPAMSPIRSTSAGRMTPLRRRNMARIQRMNNNKGPGEQKHSSEQQAQQQRPTGVVRVMSPRDSLLRVSKHPTMPTRTPNRRRASDSDDDDDRTSSPSEPEYGRLQRGVKAECVRMGSMKESSRTIGVDNNGVDGVTASPRNVPSSPSRFVLRRELLRARRQQHRKVESSSSSTKGKGTHGSQPAESTSESEQEKGIFETLAQQQQTEDSSVSDRADEAATGTAPVVTSRASRLRRKFPRRFEDTNTIVPEKTDCAGMPAQRSIGDPKECSAGTTTLATSKDGTEKSRSASPPPQESVSTSDSIASSPTDEKSLPKQPDQMKDAEAEKSTELKSVADVQENGGDSDSVPGAGASSEQVKFQKTYSASLASLDDVLASKSSSESDVEDTQPAHRPLPSSPVVRLQSIGRSEAFQDNSSSRSSLKSAVQSVPSSDGSLEKVLNDKASQSDGTTSSSIGPFDFPLSNANPPVDASIDEALDAISADPSWDASKMYFAEECTKSGTSNGIEDLFETPLKSNRSSSWEQRDGNDGREEKKDSSPTRGNLAPKSDMVGSGSRPSDKAQQSDPHPLMIPLGLEAAVNDLQSEIGLNDILGEYEGPASHTSPKKLSEKSKMEMQKGDRPTVLAAQSQEIKPSTSEATGEHEAKSEVVEHHLKGAAVQESSSSMFGSSLQAMPPPPPPPPPPPSKSPNKTHRAVKLETCKGVPLACEPSVDVTSEQNGSCSQAMAVHPSAEMRSLQSSSNAGMPWNATKLSQPPTSSSGMQQLTVQLPADQVSPQSTSAGQFDVKTPGPLLLSSRQQDFISPGTERSDASNSYYLSDFLNSAQSSASVMQVESPSGESSNSRQDPDTRKSDGSNSFFLSDFLNNAHSGSSDNLVVSAPSGQSKHKQQKEPNSGKSDASNSFISDFLKTRTEDSSSEISCDRDKTDQNHEEQTQPTPQGSDYAVMWGEERDRATPSTVASKKNSKPKTNSTFSPVSASAVMHDTKLAEKVDLAISAAASKFEEQVSRSLSDVIPSSSPHSVDELAGEAISGLKSSERSRSEDPEKDMLSPPPGIAEKALDPKDPQTEVPSEFQKSGDGQSVSSTSFGSNQKERRTDTQCSEKKFIYPTSKPSPFDCAVEELPGILSDILSFIGDPVAVCRLKMTSKACQRHVDQNEYQLMRDAVRYGGMSMNVRPYFWLWVTLQKVSPNHSLKADQGKPSELISLERAGRNGKWHSVIQRDVARSFGNLPPHKTGARLRTDSIVRALVTWGKNRLMKRGVRGCGEPPAELFAHSMDSDETPADTVSDWGGVTPVGSFTSSASGCDAEEKQQQQGCTKPKTKRKGKVSQDELALSGTALTKEMKASLQDKLSFILHSLAAAHREVGYCQGMDYVVAHLLRILQDTIRWKAANGTLPSVIKSSPRTFYGSDMDSQQWAEVYAEVDRSLVVEETCFRVVNSFLTSYNLQHFYWPELRCLKTCCLVFERLIQIKLPVLADHFEHHELNVGLFALGWFQTLFLYLPSMPSATVCHMWDIWLVERSFKIFFRVGTAILFLSQPILLNHELEGMMCYLNTFPDATLLSPDILIACALQIKVTNKMLMELEKEVLSSMPV